MGLTVRGILGSLVGIVFEYDTPKFVHIRNKKIGAVNRLVQLAIIGYIIGYGIVYQKGYLDSGPVVSVVTTKLKGAQVLPGDSDEWRQNCPNDTLYDALLDHTDLVVPPQEPNSFFVTTNLWMTCNQTLDICPEVPTVEGAICTSNDDCPKDVFLRAGNGITTGNCSEQEINGNRTCEIISWCPVENENKAVTKQGPKIDTRNFTVLVKNSISFQLKPNYHVRNIPAEASSEFLRNCSYDGTTAKGQTCPIFTLGQIVGMINDTESYYDYLATQGAVVGLLIDWDCNLEYSPSSCRPKYSARRLDNPVSSVSPGYNFRYPRYHYVGDTQYRDVIKSYGILFVIQVTGQGHVFSFTTLVLKLGSMIALLAIATTVCDILVLYTPTCILPRSKLYRQKKYQDVDVQETETNGQFNHNYGALEGDSDSFPALKSVPQ